MMAPLPAALVTCGEEGGKRNVSIITLHRIWTGLGITGKQFFDAKVFK